MPCAIMNSSNFIPVFVQLCCLSLLALRFGVCTDIVCIPGERETLLKVKYHLKDPTNRLSSWNATANSNCCQWAGVVCNNVTAHVVELHLNTSLPTVANYELEYGGYEEINDAYWRSMFGGEINPCLVHLKHLNYLDLSGNILLGAGIMPIPSFFWTMTSLTHLNLSYAGFHGKIPDQIGNLSNLLYLDLSYAANGTIPSQIGNLSNLVYLDLSYAANGPIPSQIGNLSNLLHLDLRSHSHVEPLFAENLDWLPYLSKLEYLDLGGANLSKSFDWLHTLQALPSLMHLRLSDCTLPHCNQPSLVNFSSLLTFEMSSSSDPHVISLVPKWIFGLTKLVSLQLSGNKIQGPIPDGFQNLTLLENLDLSVNSFSSSIPDWLYGLHHLKFLNLMYNNLHGTISDALGDLASLVVLDLSVNQLEGTIPMSLGNLTSLVRLDLSLNQLEGTIPTSLANLCNLRKLDFSYLKLNQQVNDILEILAPCISHGLTTLAASSSQLSGNLTGQFEVFKNLAKLDFRNNSIGGALPSSFGKLSSLRLLDLSKNQFSGNPFKSFRSLSKLSYLYINDNHFQGVVKEDDIGNLTSLKYFYASWNNLTLKVDPNWHPNFQVNRLHMSSWQLGPNFPSWIQSQNKLEYLEMFSTGISDSIPTWFWGATSQALYVNLSHNHIHGVLGTTLRNPMSIITFDLSTNNLCGKLPYLSNDVYGLDLSRNSFSESMNDFLCKNQNKPMQLEFLNLASNNLSGEIPDCWMIWPFLVNVNLQSNHFVGNLPPSMGSLALLQSFNIRNNSLSGIFPTSLKKNNQLISLDLGENNLSGTIPTWIGDKLLNMKILRLRSNGFSGHIPNEICHMSLLQVLDLAQNNLSGNIPSCFNHLNGMTLLNRSTLPFVLCDPANYTSAYRDFGIVSVLLWLKGRGDEYRNFLGLVTSIDLSDNKLLGEIPREITYLNGLLFLNLSHNQLTGRIPRSIGNMGSLLSIDFSRNQLSGEIPPTVSNLSFLSMLDLSYNHLKGKIPTGTQLQTFDASNFIGNNLCGPPLPVNCSSNGKNRSYDHNSKGSHRHGVNWFFVSMTLGFIVGFWIVIAPLFISRSWRYAYFHFLDHVWFKLQSFF